MIEMCSVLMLWSGLDLPCTWHGAVLVSNTAPNHMHLLESGKPKTCAACMYGCPWAIQILRELLPSEQNRRLHLISNHIVVSNHGKGTEMEKLMQQHATMAVLTLAEVLQTSCLLLLDVAVCHRYM
eukprot:3450886-Amphidinium_carterae.1